MTPDLMKGFFLSFFFFFFSNKWGVPWAQRWTERAGGEEKREEGWGYDTICRKRKNEEGRGGNDRGNIGIEIEKARLQSPEMSKTKTRARQESGGGRRGQSGWVCGEMGVREWGKVWEENLNVDHWYFPVPMVTPDWFPPFTLHTHTSFCYSHFHTQWDNIPHCRMLNTHTHSHTHNRMHTHTHTHTRMHA